MLYRHTHQLRPRYAETDQMGYVYYGVYPTYFEVGRVELVRSLGLSYAKLETEHGVMLPVLRLEADYKQPAYYDELLTMETALAEVPTLRITFHHTLHNSDGYLVCQGKVTLVFVDMQANKPVRPPAVFLDALSKATGA